MLRSSITRLRILGFVEGVTLLCLIGVAVPLKHFAGESDAVSLLGPIHGAVFLIYLFNVWEIALSDGWSRAEIVRTVLVSILPLGSFLNDAFLCRKQRSLTVEKEERSAREGRG